MEGSVTHCGVGMRASMTLSAALAFGLATGCDEPPPVTPTSSVASPPAAPRAVVLVDRSKQVPLDRGRARLGTIRETLLSRGLTSAQATGLGFECASLRSDATALAKEPDPLVARFLADVDKTCGLDVPLAASYAELRAIDAKRSTGTSLHAECLGLKVALGDFAPKYLSNPAVAAVGGKYATWCRSE
jgi:hypothetical protein